MHPRSDAARLLSQPALDQSFPHQRDAVVQGPRSRRARHLHHAALRIRPGASRRLARWCSAAIWKSRSPTSRAFPRRMPQTFREWNRKAEKITREIFLPERYAEPLPQAEREALLSRTALGREFLEVPNRQPLDVVRELFENEHVRLLFLFKVSLFGTWLVDTLSKTSPMGSVIRAFDLESGYQLCQGGSFNLARGLMESLHRRRRHLPAAGAHRQNRHRERQGHRHRARRRPHGARAAVRRLHARRAPDLRNADRPRAIAGGVPEKARRLPIHRLEPVRPASRAQRKPALRRGKVRSQHQPRAEMVHRRRDHGRSVLRASGRAGRPRAEARAVRLRAAEPARSDAGAAGQAHDLLLARDAARSRSRRQEL